MTLDELLAGLDRERQRMLLEQQYSNIGSTQVVRDDSQGVPTFSLANQSRPDLRLNTETAARFAGEGAQNFGTLVGDEATGYRYLTPEELGAGFESTLWTDPDYNEPGMIPGRWIGNYDASGGQTGVRWVDPVSNSDRALPTLALMAGGAFAAPYITAAMGGAGAGAGAAAAGAGSFTPELMIGQGAFAPGAAGSAAAAGGAAAAGAAGATGAGSMSIASLLSNPNTWMTGAQLVSGYLSADAAKDAANAQVGASNMAIDESRRQFDQTRADMQPWMQAGGSALQRLSGLLGLDGGDGSLMQQFTGENLASDPGYQFALGQGEQALDRAARARGGFDSGAAVKDLLRFNEGLASQRFNEAFNRDQINKTNTFNWLSGLSGTGQTTASQIGSFGANNANTVGNLVTGAGNARAAGIVGGANAVNNTIGNIANNWAQQSMLNRILGRA